MRAIEIARKMCEEVYGQGKTQLIAELCAEDVIEHEPMSGRLDRAGIEKNVQMYRRAFPDFAVKVLDSVESGDKVAIRWRATGTHQGELAGVKATGRKVTFEGISEMRIADGKIREGWDQYDGVGLLRQIGAIPESMLPSRPDGGAREARR